MKSVCICLNIAQGVFVNQCKLGMAELKWTAVVHNQCFGPICTQHTYTHLISFSCVCVRRQGGCTLEMCFPANYGGGS